MNRKTAVWPTGIPEVGQKAQRSRAVTARDIELFTELSGDRNPCITTKPWPAPPASAASWSRAV